MSAIFKAALVFCLIGAPLGFSAETHAEPPAEGPKENYYPLAVGNSWTYRAAGPKRSGKVFIRITKVENINGTDFYSLDGYFNGAYIGTEVVSQTSEGVFRHRFRGEDFNPPIQVLRYPIQHSDSWEWTGTIKNIPAKITTKVAIEDVESNSDVHRIAVVDAAVKSKKGHVRIPTRGWYVPNVGPVKMVMNIGLETFVVKLEEFEPAKTKAATE
jgi:hypothetical protein